MCAFSAATQHIHTQKADELEKKKKYKKPILRQSKPSAGEKENECISKQ